MPRAIWTGDVIFGLVSIPVALHSAESPDELSFRLLDKSTLSRIQYKRVSEQTGKEVPWDNIVKGYEYEKGQYVILTDEDFRRANVEATGTIEITDFVSADAISPVYYDKPYYLEPQKKSRKSYALLREVLQSTPKVGIARIVLRSRQSLAAVYARDKVIIVNMLRYAHELRPTSALDLPGENLKELGITTREVQLAERLVKAMVKQWKPEKYKDEYRNDLLKMIEDRVKKGQTHGVEAPEDEAKPAAHRAQVVDIMSLLQRSVEHVEKAPAASARKTPKRGQKAG